MAGGWIGQLTADLKKSPVLSNTAISFVLVGLQQVAEMHFECPCNGLLWNKFFSSLFFLVPCFLSWLLMAAVKKGRFDGLLDLASTFVPSFVWWMLLSLDGRYVACAKTEWEGRYVEIDKAKPLRWCEPKTLVNCTLDNGSTLASQDCMLLSQWYYVESQIIGIIPLAYVCVALLVYLVRTYTDWCSCIDSWCTCIDWSPPTPEEKKEIKINLDIHELILRTKEEMPAGMAQQGGTGTGDRVAGVGNANGAQELQMTCR